MPYTVSKAEAHCYHCKHFDILCEDPQRMQNFRFDVTVNGEVKRSEEGITKYSLKSTLDQLITWALLELTPRGF